MEIRTAHPKAQSILSLAPNVQNLFYLAGVRGYPIPDDLRKRLESDPRAGKPSYELPLLHASTMEIVKDENLTQKIDKFLKDYSMLNTEISSAMLKAEGQAKRELAESAYNLSMLNAFPLEGGRELMVELLSSVIKPDDPRIAGRVKELTQKRFGKDHYKMPELRVDRYEQEILRSRIADELAKGLMHIEIVSKETLLAVSDLTLEEILKDQPNITGKGLEAVKRIHEHIKNPENRLKALQGMTSKYVKTGVDEVYENNNGKFVVDYSVLSSHSVFSGGAFKRAWERWANDLDSVGFDVRTKKNNQHN